MLGTWRTLLIYLGICVCFWEMLLYYSSDNVFLSIFLFPLSRSLLSQMLDIQDCSPIFKGLFYAFSFLPLFYFILDIYNLIFYLCVDSFIFSNVYIIFDIYF